MNLTLTPHLDVAALVFYAFVLFFIGLVFYLRREDRREGYPLEDDLTGRVESPGGLLHSATSKSFKLPFCHGTVTTPTKGREPVNIAARRTENFSGAPLTPTGNPLVDGVGPAAWADRAKRPDLDWEGHPRIVPISAAEGFSVEQRDADPRGYKVVAADGNVAGTVSDLWIDKADRLIRYLQISTTGGREVLAPMTMASVRRATSTVTIDAITAAQYAEAPGIESAAAITLYEEERIVAYFGGGYLYATPGRSEPML